MLFHIIVLLPLYLLPGLLNPISNDKKVFLIYSCRRRRCRHLGIISHSRQQRFWIDGRLDEVRRESPQEVDDDDGGADLVRGAGVHGVVGHDDLRVGTRLDLLFSGVGRLRGGGLPLSLELEAAESEIDESTTIQQRKPPMAHPCRQKRAL